MNELQTIQLDILKEFSRVVNAESLKWYAMFGTLLGAARGGGFIPWDDDIDVVMPRTDYDRLRLSPELFSEPYFLQTTLNDPGAAPRFMRLRRSDTAIIPVDFPNAFTPGGHMGIYIDIIPLDIVPDMIVARGIQSLAATFNRQMYASAALDESNFGEAPASTDKLCHQRGGILGFSSVFAELYEKVCSSFSTGHYYAMPVLCEERGRRVYDREWFRECAEMDFEGFKIPVPIGWRETLVVSYPEGLYEPDTRYRKIEASKKRFTDTKRSYKVYTQRYTDMLHGIEGKKVYIFGAGDSLRIWLERYSQGLDVIYAFDNAEEKWNTAAYGVTVRNPDELPELLDKNSRLIVASIHHKEIGEQLSKMGIEDYFVFIDGWNYRKAQLQLKLSGN